MNGKADVIFSSEHLRALQRTNQVLNDELAAEDVKSYYPQEIVDRDKTCVYNVHNNSIKTKMIGNKLKKFLAISLDSIEQFDQLYIYDSRGKIKANAIREMVVVIVDIVDSTKNMEKDGLLRSVRKYDALLDGLIDNSELFNPVLIKPTGDGILVLFDTSDMHMAATFGIQTVLTVKGLVENELNMIKNEHFGNLREDIKIEIAVGVTCGEVVYGIFGQNHLHYLDALGTPINLAARLQAETRKYSNTNIFFDDNFVKKVLPVLPNTFFRRKLAAVSYLKGLERREIYIYDNPTIGDKDSSEVYNCAIQLVEHLERRDIRNIQALIGYKVAGALKYTNFTETKKTVRNFFLRNYIIPKLLSAYGKEDEFCRELIAKLIELTKTEDAS